MRAYSPKKLAVCTAVICLVLLTALNAKGGDIHAFRLRSKMRDTIKLVFLGDIMLGRGVTSARMALRSENAWDGVFDAVRPVLQDADLVFGNLEGPLVSDGCDRPSDLMGETGEYLLYSPVEAARALSTAGVDILALANNHIMDCGDNGVAATKNALQAAGMRWVGPDLEPLNVTIKGWETAILAVNTLQEGLSVENLETAIRKARQASDLVIISLHWGSEYQAGPNRVQIEIAERLARAGADIVWGHHPHTLQRIECQDGQTHGRTLVMYSLGNAIFDQQAPPFVNRSAAVTVTVAPEGKISVGAYPFEIDPGLGVVKQAGKAVAIQVQERLQTPLSCP